MKELEPKIIDPKEVRAVIPVKKERVVKKLFPLPGHRIFQLDLSTGIIDEVLPEKNNAALVPEIDIRTGKVTGTTTQEVGKLKRKEGCLYCTALNGSNADKIFHRLLNKPYKKKK